MAKIVEYREIPLGDLKVGKAQVRTHDPGRDIEQLATSIEKQGLLQPIVVCEAEEAGKWEILTGQRRFLAHRMLKRDTITAAILDERVDAGEAKAISITENLIRRNLHGTELIDGITFLYNLYGGSAKAVHDVTGIPYDDIRHYVKYPRLMAPLKKLVDDGEIDIKVAVKAQDAVDVGDENPSAEDALKLAREMGSMSDAQRRKLVRERKENPETSVDDAIEQARTGSKITQVIVTLTGDAHTALQRCAKDDGVTQDEAAAGFIMEGLISRGFLEE
jgi:ParB family chromosome partitioning protein